MLILLQLGLLLLRCLRWAQPLPDGPILCGSRCEHLFLLQLGCGGRILRSHLLQGSSSSQRPLVARLDGTLQKRPIQLQLLLLASGRQRHSSLLDGRLQERPVQLQLLLLVSGRQRHSSLLP
jgi:hypothetical protein